MQAINKANVASAALPLLAYLDSNLQDLEWLLGTMKTSQGSTVHLPFPCAFLLSV